LIFLLRLICKNAYRHAARMNSELHSESLDKYGNVNSAFSANGFVLPRFARRRREFELRFSSIACHRSIFVNRSSAFESRSSGLVGGSSHCDPRSSQLKCSCSGLDNGSSVLETAPRPGLAAPPASQAAPRKGIAFLRFQIPLLRVAGNRACFTIR
jgi:hypothetical protein